MDTVLGAGLFEHPTSMCEEGVVRGTGLLLSTPGATKLPVFLSHWDGTQGLPQTGQTPSLRHTRLTSLPFKRNLKLPLPNGSNTRSKVGQNVPGRKPQDPMACCCSGRERWEHRVLAHKPWTMKETSGFGVQHKCVGLALWVVFKVWESSLP